MKKITLSAEAEVIAEAHRLAEEKGVSVSALFSRFVRFLVKKEGRTSPLGRVTKKATGLIKLPEKKNEREVLEEALAEKHGI